MKARLVGIHKVRMRLASGERATYYYAWRGGPRIKAEAGTRAFIAEYVRLTHGRDDAVKKGILAEIVIDYQASPEYAGLRDRTKRDYNFAIERILEKYADLPIHLLDQKGARASFTRWRDSMSDTPRKADVSIAVLARILSFAVDREIININKAAGIGKLATKTRSDIIWTDEQIDAWKTGAPKPLADALMLALHTGQRQGDLLTVKWSAYDGRVITLRQAKSNFRRQVRIVVDPELKQMLDSMERTAITILTNSHGVPWRKGFGASWQKCKTKLGIDGVTFHDLRGTYITHAYRRGHSIKAIAEATGHSEAEAERIIRTHYLAADLTDDVNESRTEM